MITGTGFLNVVTLGQKYRAAYKFILYLNNQSYSQYNKQKSNLNNLSRAQSLKFPDLIQFTD
jgi:hypothetical protein